MRIAYGIFGYGRGHATRSGAMLRDLSRGHELQVFAGGDAYEALWTDFGVTRIPTLGYAHKADARRSNYRTFTRNIGHVLDILGGGRTFRAMRDAMRAFRPDVVISDAEPWTHRVALSLGVPRISFDHFGIMAYCRPPLPLLDRLKSRLDVFVYRRLMGRPERALVSSFYDAPPLRPDVQCVGPILRDEVLALRPTRGERLVAYFNKGEYQFTARIEAALRGLDAPVQVYGTPRRGSVGNLDFRPLSSLPFLEELAACRALISTAGNQLVGEAMHLGKPMLVIPEDCVEQRLNGAHVERLGIGMCVPHARFSAEIVRQFLRNDDSYRARIAERVRDGRAEALAAIEKFIAELTGSAQRAGSAAAPVSSA